MRTSVTPWAAALGVLPLTLALSGCFGGPAGPNVPGPGPDSAEDQQVDEMVEDMVEGSGDDLDFEAGELPDDFPVDAVPLVPGEVLNGLSVGGTAWTVTIATADQATAESAASLLEAAGYTNDSMFAWENAEYLVIVVSTEEMDDGRWGVHYQVQEQS